MSEEEKLSALEISERFMTGDLIKVLVNEMKLMQLGWGMTPERQQQLIIERITEKVKHAVIDVTHIIAANGRPHIEAIVEQVVFKDGVKAVLQISKASAERHALSDAVGNLVIVVIPQSEKHLGGDAPQADRDQMTIEGM